MLYDILLVKSIGEKGEGNWKSQFAFAIDKIRAAEKVE